MKKLIVVWFLFCVFFHLSILSANLLIAPLLAVSSSLQSNKPIMEKKRRARINHCLNELKTLILEAMKKDVSVQIYFYSFTHADEFAKYLYEC